MRNPRSRSISSFSSVLMETGENDTIFCFVFAAMKTDTFENALVWMEPKLTTVLPHYSELITLDFVCTTTLFFSTCPH